MNKILKRDDFIKDIYTPMLEEKEYNELVSINEGLIRTLFGMAKNLFRKDWDSIKGDSAIIEAYRELDNRLTGFSTMKLAKKDICNKIRQELVDFACDWYDMKMNKAKEDDTDPIPAKSMRFKSDTLRENVELMEKRIKDIAGNDEQILKWANILKEGMKTVINRAIIDDINDEKIKKETEEKINKQIEDLKKENKLMEEFQNEKLKEIQKERQKLISNTKSEPIKEDLLGDKAIQNLCGAFDTIRNTKDVEARKDKMKLDSTFGFKAIFDDEDYEKPEFKTAYALIDSFYTALGASDVMKKFNETPGQSVQAMCIAINAFIKNCVYGGTDYGKVLPLMAKCAVVSDGTVSYNLPLNDKTGDEAGNYFTDIAKIITDGQMKNVKGKTIKLNDDFKKNASTLLNKIVQEAKKLKEDADKKYNDELERLKTETEKESV